jgi:putative phage-type endonuclease
MRIVNCTQGSPEWLAARAGKVTSCRVADALAFSKRNPKEELDCRRKYKRLLVTERLGGISFDTGYKSRAMKEGKEAEPMARAAYELLEDVMVEPVGFVLHPSIEFAGASPDGLVGDDGLVEIKAPEVFTHVDYLLENKIPDEYIPQCMWMLAVTGREWIDFVSYDKSHTLPEDKQLFVKRLVAEQNVLEECYNARVRQFLAEVNGLLLQLDALDKVTAQ